MAIYKSVCSWVPKGICSTNGDIANFWRTNAAMPIPDLKSGSYSFNSGWMAARYCDIGGSSQGLIDFCPGYGVGVADGLFRWCLTNGSCLNGITCVNLFWYRGSTCIGGPSILVCLDGQADPGSWYWMIYETMSTTAVWDTAVCCDGTYCTKAYACTISGDDSSISSCDICFDFGGVPSVSKCSSLLTGSIWVEGDDLAYINACRWENKITGTCQGSGASPGAIWIDNSHYLNWANSGGCWFQAPWRICQFCSWFGCGAPDNPSPGASYAGSIWVDDEFGCTHLAYIGCDGNKYLAGGGDYPYSAP